VFRDILACRAFTQLLNQTGAKRQSAIAGPMACTG